MDAEFQEILTILKEEFRKEMIGTFIPDKNKMKMIEDTMSVLEKIVKCDNIEMRVDTPFIGSVDILMSGKEIHVLEPEVFGELLMLSDVSEIVIGRNGLNFNITYYGTSKKVGG